MTAPHFPQATKKAVQLRRILTLSALAALMEFLVGCQDRSQAKVEHALVEPQRAEQRLVGYQPEQILDSRLHNAYRIHTNVISGAAPDAASLAALQELGVRTIISVDGARPDVDLAKTHGMRYVHLPHGYDAVPEQRIRELAKALITLPGPIYLHCHHGKHRGPAAAASACIAAGFLRPEDGTAVLRAAGTSSSYLGLYRSVSNARAMDEKTLLELTVEFHESNEVPPIAEAMVALEATYDRIKTIAENGWSARENSPEIDPAHEALLLREHFTELLRLEEVSQQPEAFRMILDESEVAAESLEKSLNVFSSNSTSTEVPSDLPRLLAVITSNCKKCHQAYRDVPIQDRQ